MNMEQETETEIVESIGEYLRRSRYHSSGDIVEPYDIAEDDTYHGYGRWEQSKLPETAQGNESSLYFVPGVLSGSDYSGSSVEQSNFRVFMEQFGKGKVPGVVELSGGYGTYGIAIRLDVRNAEIIQILKSLESYPIIDEEDMSSLEIDQDAEAWESWAREDFKREIHKRFGIDVGEVSDDAISEVFRKACDETNTYFECDGADRYIRVEEVAKGCDLETLRALPGAIEDDDAEDARTIAIRKDEEKRVSVLHRSHFLHGKGGHDWTPTHPARSVAKCATCGRQGWINVSPVDGAPTRGGKLFEEHCGHGKNPSTHCDRCGESKQDAPGILGKWNHSDAGKKCDDWRHYGRLK